LEVADKNPKGSLSIAVSGNPWKWKNTKQRTRQGSTTIAVGETHGY